MTTFILPELPYAYDALAPYVSKETLEFHHDKHHKAYVDKGNELIVGTGLEGKPVEDVMMATVNDAARVGLYNQAGQCWNHAFQWACMKPNGGGSKMPLELERAIADSFGSFDAFKAEFVNAGLTQFGSGWCWLVLDPATGKLSVTKTGNAGNPMTAGKKPLLTCDVWEHAYYIDFRNARAKYLEAYVDHLINWDTVAHMLAKAA